jgi:pimeloyl-ACP methyl ester carboxylesterase
MPGSGLVEDQITASPDAQAHARAEPERVGTVVLVDAVDAGRCIWHRIYPAGRDWARVGQLFGVSL